MPRRVQDIIPGNRRSIRDIPLSRSSERESVSHTSDQYSSKTKKHKDEEVVKIHREHTVHDESESDGGHVISPKSKIIQSSGITSGRRKFPWAISIVVVVIVLAGLGFAFSGSFARASFDLVPKVISTNVNGTYIIPKSTSGAFGYEIMTLKGTASTTVDAKMGSYTETKASGTIKIYNSYSASTQRLVAGTRFSNDSGLVYRLTSSITVPGYKKSGSTIVPGTITAKIVADKAGSEYNISRSDSISDMKIMAFKGTARYDGFYGRLTTDVVGGFAGTRIVVDQSILASTTSKLEKDLSAKLGQQMLTVIPSGYVMYNNAYTSDYGTPKVTSVNSSTALISVDATVNGIMFKANDLAKFLSGATSTASFGSFGYTAPDISSISFSIANQKDFSAISGTNLVARINGTFNLVGNIPVSDIKKQLGGMSLSQTKDVLKKYSSVIDLSKSVGEINPPWVGAVPNDLNHVSITVKKP